MFQRSAYCKCTASQLYFASAVEHIPMLQFSSHCASIGACLSGQGTRFRNSSPEYKIHFSLFIISLVHVSFGWGGFFGTTSPASQVSQTSFDWKEGKQNYRSVTDRQLLLDMARRQEFKGIWRLQVIKNRRTQNVPGGNVSAGYLLYQEALTKTSPLSETLVPAKFPFRLFLPFEVCFTGIQYETERL